MPRGGRRSGAGRPKGSRNRTTHEIGLAISAVARDYGPEALDILMDVARNGSTDSARVAAANALLDRGYGRTPHGYDMIPLSAVIRMQEVMGQIVAKNVPDKEVALQIADDWKKINIEV